jgi:hypothetical protein
MRRRDLIDLLLDRPMAAGELARALDLRPRELAAELEHLRQSLRHEPYRLEVDPARCRKCGFTFDPDKLSKPGKCPRCRGTWIREPRIWVSTA